MSTWRTTLNYNSHPGAPPTRPNLREVTLWRPTLLRVRYVQTDDADNEVDSGWSEWGEYGIGIDWLIHGYAIKNGDSYTETECMIEVAPGIGRPWKILWRDMITSSSDGEVNFSGEQEQVFAPGTSSNIVYSAADGTTRRLGSAAVLIPADGLL